MAAIWVRRAVLVTSAVGIAGVIAGSIAESTGLAMTAGVVAAIAVLCLILVTVSAGPGGFARPAAPDEHAAADLERRVQRLVASGTDEAELRSLLRAAARLHKNG